MVKVVKIGGEEESSAIEEEVEPRTEFAEYKDKQEKVKKVYYFLVIIQYLAICYYFASYGLEDDSLFLLAVWTIAYAILLPIILVIIGFTISGGFLVGIITSLTYGLLGLLARFIMKILGFDVELIFPELEGHIGVVCNPNALNRYTSYNLSVEIEKAGLYGNSFWHGNKIAARSKEGEIPVGTNVDVIEANYWSLSSLLRNSPVITVVPIGGQVLESEVEEKSFLREMANIFRIVLLLIGILFIFLAGLVFSTCNATGCGTVMDTVPCFSVSIISFILFYYMGKIE